MATPNEYVQAELNYLGVCGTDNIFNTWIWGQHVYIPEIYPWCAAFQSYVGVHDLGMCFKPSASASGVAFQGTPIYYEDLKRGDWVLFNWDGRNDFSFADHIGLVTDVDFDIGLIRTVEGNSNDCVRRCNRYINWGYSMRFFRPPYDNEKVPEPFTKEEETMNVIVEHVNGSPHSAYFDGHDLHDLSHEDDIAALDKWYTEAYGKPMPRVDGGAENAPWTSRIMQIVNAGPPSKDIVPDIDIFKPR